MSSYQPRVDKQTKKLKKIHRVYRVMFGFLELLFEQNLHSLVVKSKIESLKEKSRWIDRLGFLLMVMLETEICMTEMWKGKNLYFLSEIFVVGNNFSR